MLHGMHGHAAPGSSARAQRACQPAAISATQLTDHYEHMPGDSRVDVLVVQIVDGLVQWLPVREPVDKVEVELSPKRGAEEHEERPAAVGDPVRHEGRVVKPVVVEVDGVVRPHLHEHDLVRRPDADATRAGHEDILVRLVAEHELLVLAGPFLVVFSFHAIAPKRVLRLVLLDVCAAIRGGRQSVRASERQSVTAVWHGWQARGNYAKALTEEQVPAASEYPEQHEIAEVEREDPLRRELLAHAQRRRGVVVGEAADAEVDRVPRPEEARIPEEVSASVGIARKPAAHRAER
jgi:hypothetical protein